MHEELGLVDRSGLKLLCDITAVGSALGCAWPGDEVENDQDIVSWHLLVSNLFRKKVILSKDIRDIKVGMEGK